MILIDHSKKLKRYMEMNWNRIETLSLFIFCFYSLFRSLFHLVIQIYYYHFIKEANQDLSYDMLQRKKFIEDLMLATGHIHRTTSGIGIFAYALYFLSNCCLYMTRFVHSFDFLTYLNQNRLILFLRDPDKETFEISVRFNECLRVLIESNVNFTRMLVNKCTDESSVEDEDFTELESNFHKSFAEVKSGNTSIISPMSEFITFISKRRFPESWAQQESFDVEDSMARSHVTSSLIRQRDFLIQLAFKKTEDTIWPANRTLLWLEKSKLFWKITYFSASLYGWVMGEFFTILSPYVVKASLMNSNLDEKYREFTVLDRLASAEYCIFVYFAIDWYLVPFTVLILNMCDQLKAMESINIKVRQLVRKIVKLERQREFYLDNLKANSTNTISHEKFEQDKYELELECDKEALELYISYQLFRFEAKSSIGSSRFAIAKNLSFFLLTMITSITYCGNSTQGRHYVHAVLILTLIIVNVSFCSYAVIKARYKLLSKVACLIVGLDENYNQFQYLTSVKNVDEDHACELSNVTSSLIANSRDKNNMTPGRVDFIYFSNGALSPHTKFLWRRLIENQDAVIDSFKCKFYGILEVDYGNILKFNYWAISCLLFTSLHAFDMF